VSLLDSVVPLPFAGPKTLEHCCWHVEETCHIALNVQFIQHRIMKSLSTYIHTYHPVKGFRVGRRGKSLPESMRTDASGNPNLVVSMYFMHLASLMHPLS